jgi:hypothetical protein
MAVSGRRRFFLLCVPIENRLDALNESALNTTDQPAKPILWFYPALHSHPLIRVRVFGNVCRLMGFWQTVPT